MQKIKTLMSGRMDPTGCLLDFEEVMSSAWQEVFPNCGIMRDFFYLQQANTKKMAKISLLDLRKEIVKDIRVLWFADTKVEFDVQLQLFLDKWDERAPEYATYFRRVWIEQHPPNSWASYSRPNDAPSGWWCFFIYMCLPLLKRKWQHRGPPQSIAEQHHAQFPFAGCRPFCQ
jgi:hypothetical protein